MKVHYPKLYNMAHLFTFNVFTDFKGSNNYIFFTEKSLCFVVLKDLTTIAGVFQMISKH